MVTDLDRTGDGRVTQSARPRDLQSQEAAQALVARQLVREDQQGQRLAPGGVGRLDQLAERERTEWLAERVRPERLRHGGLSDAMRCDRESG